MNLQKVTITGADDGTNRAPRRTRRSPDELRAIADAIAGGASYEEVSGRFGVAMGSIHGICKRRGVSKRPPKQEPRRLDDGSWEIPLTKGFTAVIDAEDLPKVASLNWYAEERPNGRVYAAADRPNKWGKIFLHRLVMGEPGNLDVDHGDRNGLNCRKRNLRICDRTRNNGNSIPRKSRSGFKGVSYDRRDGKWTAGIWFERRHFSLGRFNDPAEAAVAYDRKAVELYGEFARTNFLTEVTDAA